MKRKKQTQEQFYNDDHAALTVQEPEETFTLEDILREFGTEAPAPQDTVAETPPVAAEAPEQPKPPVMEQQAPEQPEPPAMEQQAPAAPAAPKQRKKPSAPPKPQEPVRAKAPRRPPAESVRRAAERVTAEPASSRHAAPARQAAQQRPAQKRPVQKQPKPAPKPEIPVPEVLCRDCMHRLGTSRLRLVFCGILSVLSVLLVIYHEYQLVLIPFLNQQGAAAGLCFALWVLCALLAFDVLAAGVRQLVTFHIQLEALLSVAVVLTAADGVLALRAGSFPYCAMGTLALTFGLWGLSDGLLGAVHTLRVVQAADKPKAVMEAEDAWNGQNGLFRAAGDQRDFMEQYQKTDLTTQTMRIYAPVMLILSLGAAIYLSVSGRQPFVQTWLLLLTGATPLCGFLCYARPFCLLAKQLAKVGAAVCGWAGAEIFRGRHTILLRDADVFPNVSFNGMKLFGGHSMDRVVAYAAAVSSACGSTLAPMFEELRAAQNCRHYDVRKYRYYEGGIGAEVMEDVVLMGSLRFMNSMGVHMDAGMRVKQAVYLSVNGELAGVFALKYSANTAVGSGLSAIVRSGYFDTVLAARDFLVTPEYLQYKYGVSKDSVVYPQVKERLRLSEQKLTEDGRQGAILTKDSFAAFAQTVSGGRTLRSCVQAGTVLALLSGVVGFLLMLLLLSLNAMKTASVFNMTLFLLAWALPGLLLSQWTRRG